MSNHQLFTFSYFKPKTTKIRSKWNDEHRDLLIQGIEQYGVGHWSEIKNNLLSEWQEQELRVKASILIGRQNLTAYKHWKGNAQDIEREHRKNYDLGTRLGQWKGGYLVADDAGKVVAELAVLDANLQS